MELKDLKQELRSLQERHDALLKTKEEDEKVIKSLEKTVDSLIVALQRIREHSSFGNRSARGPEE